MLCNAQKLTEFVKDSMLSAGLSKEFAEIFADTLVFADMRGVSSHGVTRLPVYHKRLATGQVNCGSDIRITEERAALFRIDGQNEMGAPLAVRAMEKCIEKARVSGSCFAAVNHANHFGCAGYFTKMAAEAGMIGIAMADANKMVAPTGAKEPMLGTNPFSIAFPAYGKTPFLLDMATAVVANGKIVLAKKEGHSIPEGWGMDENGQVTTDPNRVKFLMPFGGYKGYGFSMAIDLFCSTFAGAANSRNMGSFWKAGDGNVQNTGFFLGAFDPAAFMDPEEFAKGVAAYIDEMKQAKKADGVEEILVAGEPEERKYQKALSEGVQISDVVAEELKKFGEEIGLTFDVAF